MINQIDFLANTIVRPLVILFFARAANAVTGQENKSRVLYYHIYQSMRL